jgi:hypothetical protein
MGLKSKPLDQLRESIPVDEVTREDIVRININVPESLRQRWKIAAVQEKRPMTDIIIDAMSLYLDTHMSK